MIAGLLEMNVEEVLRSSGEAEVSFASRSEVVDDVRRLAFLALGSDLSVLPPQGIGGLGEYFGEAKATFDEMRSFRVAADDQWRGRHQKLIMRLDKLRDSTSGEVLKFLAFAKAQEPLQVVAALMEQVREAGNRAASIAQDAAGNLAARTDEVINLERRTSALLEALQEQAQSVSIAKHAQVFQNEAIEHETTAGRWLKAGGLAVVILTLLVIRHLAWVLEGRLGMTTGDAINASVAKIIAYSLAVSGLLIIVRVYRANRHNAVVNRHRANALMCFEALSQSTSDPDTKNAILRQATSSIFAPQVTGFIEGDTDTGSTPTVLEMYRSVAPITGKSGAT